MRIHIIKEEENYLIYLPDLLKFFKANESTAQLAELISSGKSFNEVLQVFPDIEHSIYESFYNQFQTNKENTPNFDISTDEFNKYLPRLVIHISNSCNLKCKYCYAQGGNYLSEKGNISLEMLDKILDSFFTIFEKIDVINLFGGEPTLNVPAIERVAKYIAENKKDTRLGMITNGTLINDKLASLIAEHDINVTFSVDEKNMHDILRPCVDNSGSYDRIKKSFEKLRAVSNQPSQVEVVYTKEHVNHGISISDVIKQIQEEFGQLPVHLTPVSTDDLTYKLENEESFMKSVDDVFTDDKLSAEADYSFTSRIISTLRNKQPTTNICAGGFGTISVSVKGDIYPCFYLNDQKELKITDVNKQLEEVKEMVSKARLNYYKKNERNSGKCSTCFANTVCYGCLGVNYFSTGDLYETPEFHCNLVKGSLEKILLNLAKSG